MKWRLLPVVLLATIPTVFGRFRNRFVFTVFSYLALSSTSARAIEFIPKNVTSVSARAFRYPANIYRAGNGCAESLATVDEEAPFRGRILREAKRIGETVYGRESGLLLANLGRLDEGRVLPGALADAFEDDGLNSFGDALRAGIVATLHAPPPRRNTQKYRGNRLKQFMYLIKLNKIPAPFITEEQHRSELYFADDILYGAAVEFSDFWAARKELAQHPTFEHLYVEVNPRDFVRMVKTDAMRRLTSLDVFFGAAEDLPPVSEELATQLQKKAQFKNLRRLRLYGNIGDWNQQKYASALFRLFRSAENLEELELNGIVIDPIDSPQILRRLKSLELTDIFPIGGTLDGLEVFFRALNPDLRSLSWKNTTPDETSRNAGRILHDSAPHFSGLRYFNLDLQEVPPQQWSWLEVNNGLWENLEGARITVHSSRFPTSLVETLNRILRKAAHLTSLNLSGAAFPIHQVSQLFAEVKAPLDKLTLGVWDFEPAVYGVIGKTFPKLSSLTQTGTQLRLSGIGNLNETFPHLRLLVGQLPRNPTEAKRVTDMLKQMNIDVEWIN